MCVCDVRRSASRERACIDTHTHTKYILLVLEDTAILIISEGHETAFSDFKYQCATRKPLKNVKLTLGYYENGSSS